MLRMAYTANQAIMMDFGKQRAAIAIISLFAILSPVPMLAFAARMGSPDLLSAFVRTLPTPLGRRVR